jgi:hypothetical protein
MQPVTAGALARLLREADADTRRRFVAALHDERGAEAWVDDESGGEGVVCVREGADRDGGDGDGGVRRVLVRTRAPGDVPAGADAVVVTRVVDDPPADVADARAVRDLLLYGLDRERARALFESTFDRPLVEPSADGPGDASGEGPAARGAAAGGGGGGGDAAGGRRGSGPLGRLPSALAGVRDRWAATRAGRSGRAWRAGVAAVVLVAVAVAVVGAAALGGVPGGAVAGPGDASGSGGVDDESSAASALPPDAPDSRGDSPGSAVSTDEDAPAVVGSGARTVGTEPAGGANGSVADETRPPGGTTLPPDHPATLPPGVAPGGVTDEVDLARAHARALEGRSYRVTLVHRETVDGRPAAVRRETVRVANATRYVSTVEGFGDLRREPLVVRDAAAYVNGSLRAERGTGVDGSSFGAAFSAGVGGDPADRVATYVRWFLSVEESRVVDAVERDGRRLYWLVLDGDSYPGVENTTGTALVDGTGLVHEVRRSYDYPSEDGVGATVTVRYDRLDATTVEPPAWYDGDVERSSEPPPWYVSPSADDASAREGEGGGGSRNASASGDGSRNATATRRTATASGDGSDDAASG